jgi:hypothetical protein
MMSTSVICCELLACSVANAKSRPMARMACSVGR